MRFIWLSWQMTKANPLWGIAVVLQLIYITACVYFDLRDGRLDLVLFIILGNAFAGWLGWKLGQGR